MVRNFFFLLFLPCGVGLSDTFGDVYEDTRVPWVCINLVASSGFVSHRGFAMVVVGIRAIAFSGRFRLSFFARQTLLIFLLLL
jgi:hypothetical protein